MVWSLLYRLTRTTLGVLLLRVRGDAAKDVEILVLRHQLAVCRSETWLCAVSWGFVAGSAPWIEPSPGCRYRWSAAW
jgi:hypothetical protein